jgi:glutaredoxin
VRYGLVVLTLGFVVAVFVWNATNKPEPEKRGVWNANMTKGDPTAENHFIEYVDMLCPYCAKFNAALDSQADNFQRDYLDNKKVYYELRLADMISDHNANSYRGNVAGYCAARGGNEQFWAFYDAVQVYMTDTYYSKGIGDKKGAPEIPRFENDVYVDIAKSSGVAMDDFRSCLDGEETKAELERATTKARAANISGVPYFVFNEYRSSGFDGTYSTIVQMFRAGGVQ